MTDDLIIQRMAELEFGSTRVFRADDGKLWCVENNTPLFVINKNYLDDHNAVYDLINGLKTIGMCVDFVNELGNIIYRDFNSPSSTIDNLTHVNNAKGVALSCYYYIITTPRQKCEAILRATNRWIDNED